MDGMTTRRPYLIRAFNEWILDNGMTPYLSVNADYEGTVVPREYVVDGEIILNISPSSVRHLELGQEYVLFDARFSGRSFQITIPVKAVLAIFAKENGEGMAFVYEQGADPDVQHTRELSIHSENDSSEKSNKSEDEDPIEPPPTSPGGRPKLKIVK